MALRWFQRLFLVWNNLIIWTVWDSLWANASLLTITAQCYRNIIFWLLQIFDIFEEKASVETQTSSQIYASWEVKLPGIYMSRCNSLVSPEDSVWTRGSDDHIVSAERLLFWRSWLSLMNSTCQWYQIGQSFRRPDYIYSAHCSRTDYHVITTTWAFKKKKKKAHEVGGFSSSVVSSGSGGGGLLTQLFWAELRFNEGRVDVSLTVTHRKFLYGRIRIKHTH